MSRGATLVTLGWETLLAEHGIDATYTPAVGSPVALLVLDNGTPEDVQQLAMGVDGVARIVSATRTDITATVGDTVTIGATQYAVLAIRPRSDQAVDLLLGVTEIAGNQTATTYTVYWGASESTTLNEAGITGLENNIVSATPAGNYVFTITGEDEKFCFFAWPNAMLDQPVATSGFKAGSFNMTGDMAGAAQGFVSSQNGWNYTTVSVGGVSYRLYRTLYTQASTLAITVNAA